MLFIAPSWTTRALHVLRDWLIRNARYLAAGIVLLLAASLLRNGIAGLTS
jgi:hypothetical protein